MLLFFHWYLFNFLLLKGQVKDKAAIDARIVSSREALEKMNDEIINSIDKQMEELQSQVFLRFHFISTHLLPSLRVWLLYYIYVLVYV